MTSSEARSTALEPVYQFRFQEQDVRATRLEDGSTWFVAKDVCAVLGISDHHQAVGGLDEEERGRYIVPTPSSRQEMVIISEPGLYKLIFKSRKPEAKAFTRWVTSEVLPTLRKTGSYTMPEAKTSSPAPTVATPKFAKEISQLHRDFVRTAKTFGLSPEQAALSASQAVRKLYGVDFIELLAVPGIKSPSQERHLTPTQIGEPQGLSGRQVNEFLARQGFQYRDDHGNWKPTTHGKPYAVLVDTTKRHRNGTPVQQLRWLGTITDKLYLGDDSIF